MVPVRTAMFLGRIGTLPGWIGRADLSPSQGRTVGRPASRPGKSPRPRGCSFLISDVLKQPFGRNLPAETRGFGFAIDQPADRGELQALVAEVVVEGDLFVVRPAPDFAGDDIAIIRIIAAGTAFH